MKFTPPIPSCSTENSSFHVGDYSFGFNGQEKEKQITDGNSHTSAEFWIYDLRLGRRLQGDQVIVTSLSHYSCFYNNPIRYSDTKGNDPGGPEGNVEGGVDCQASATVSYTLGGNNTSSLSFSFGASFMANLSIGDFSSQIALSCNYNYSNGGLGMANGQSSAIDDGLSNIFIACAGTVGYDEAPEIQQNLFNYFSTSTLNNENRFSLTYAPSLIFSNDDRDQQNATIAFRVGRVSMFVMEDSGSFGLTDGEDRWWTGSGGLNVDLRGLGNNGLTTFMINSDTYTGNSYNKDYLINDYEYGGFSGNNDYFWANQEDFDPIGNSGYNRSLNMAQTRISLVTSDNTTYSFSQTGPNHFMAQNVIHDFLCFHHFKPATDNANNLFSITMGN